MNNITLAKESLKIQKDKYYIWGGEKIVDFGAVKVYPPQSVKTQMNARFSDVQYILVV